MKKSLVIFLGILMVAFSAFSAEIIVEQKNKLFFYQDKQLTPDTVIAAKVGDVLRFVNADTVVHNLFSLSEGMVFDVGPQYPKDQNGQDVIVPLKKAGLLKVECAIHPQMTLQIKID